jgi:hypothetical protein
MGCVTCKKWIITVMSDNGMILAHTFPLTRNITECMAEVTETILKRNNKYPVSIKIEQK